MRSMLWTDEPFEPVPLPVLFLRSPLKTVIKVVHTLLSQIRGAPRPHNPSISVVCISDSHSKTKALPDGDILVHAGDLTDAGTQKDIQAQIDWLDAMPHRYKHLPRSQISPEGLDWKSVIYLQHSTISLDFPSHAGRKLKVYGAPQIPACGGPEFAFQYPRGQDAWSDTVPKDTDILLTHTPPMFHRDLPTGRGCEYLLRELWRVKPILHVFGHIHAGRGKEVLFWDGAQSAYESASTRKDGLVAGMFDIRLWISLAKVLIYGSLGFLWSAVWGGRQDSSRLVNASLTYRNTGQLRNGVQVVRI